VVEAATHLPTTILTKVGIQNNTGQYLFGLYHRTLVQILIRTLIESETQSVTDCFYPESHYHENGLLSYFVVPGASGHEGLPGVLPRKDRNLMPGEQQASRLRAAGLSGQAFRLSSE